MNLSYTVASNMLMYGATLEITRTKKQCRSKLISVARIPLGSVTPHVREELLEHMPVKLVYKDDITTRWKYDGEYVTACLQGVSHAQAIGRTSQLYAGLPARQGRQLAG